VPVTAAVVAGGALHHPVQGGAPDEPPTTDLNSA